MTSMNQRIDDSLKRHGIIEKVRVIMDERATACWTRELCQPLDSKIVVDGQVTTVQTVDWKNKSITIECKNRYTMVPLMPKGNRHERRRDAARERR